MHGATWFPVYQTTNLMTSALVAFFFMGYMLRYRPVWFRKYNYLLGVGLDCGTQLCQTVIMLGLDLSGSKFPNWWGKDVCFFYPLASLFILCCNNASSSSSYFLPLVVHISNRLSRL